MLNDSERQRFNHLRGRQARGESLSSSETAEVTEFNRRLEEAENDYLGSVTARLRADNLAAGERIRALEALVEREERFVSRLRATLAELQTEQRLVAAERQRLRATSVTR